MSDSQTVQQLSVDVLDPNPYQPRKTFDEVALNELAGSIREHGVLEPVKARPVGSGKKRRYQLAFGERRLRASKLAGCKTIPVIVEQMDDATMEAVALIENVQREDLTPIEEAVSYQRLLSHYDLFELHKKIGKSTETIQNRVDLLALPDEVQAWVDKGALSLGCAEVLCGLEKRADQANFAKLAMTRNLTPAKLRGAVQRVPKKTGTSTKRESGRRGGRKVTAKSVTSALVSCYTTLDKYDEFGRLNDEQKESFLNQVAALRKVLDGFEAQLEGRVSP